MGRLAAARYSDSFVTSAIHKLIILFKQPANPAEFEQRWSEEFVPLAEKLIYCLP